MALADATKVREAVNRPTSLLIREHMEYLIQQATDRTRGNITEAAKLLGVDRTTLSHWVNRGLSRKYYVGAKSEPASGPSGLPDAQ